MARQRSAALTDGEVRIMRVLWQRSRATVAEVVDGLEGTQKPAYNTVLTMLRILERKGYVAHEKDGRAFTYLPLIDHGQARRHALSHLLKRFFDDSPELLVLDLLGHEHVDPDELQRVRERIARAAAPTEGKRKEATRR